MTAEKDLWAISDYLATVPHIQLLAPEMEKRLNRMDKRLYAAGRVGSVE